MPTMVMLQIPEWGIKQCTTTQLDHHTQLAGCGGEDIPINHVISILY
jgi:hypothetical protein